jgi:D-methionine transport system ATP-binding protein
VLSSIDFQAGAFLQRAPAFFVVILRLALYQEMKYMISIQNLYKSYPCEGGDFEALRNISINIQSGEIFGIIGLSGAGKSTLLRTLNRLEEPSSGSICIGDTDITQLSTPELRKLRRRVGMIFQHFNLLTSRTVFQNVAFPLEIEKWETDAISKRVTEVLDLVDLSDKAQSYPSQLSGGQKQRVGIARALANNPSLLLCDEATSALDPNTTQSILALLDEINRKLGITIVLVTHEMGVIRQICHRVAVLEHGQVVELGAVKDVFMKPQSKTAREFLCHLPRTTYDFENLPQEKGKPVAIFAFNGEMAEQPVISQAIKKSGAEINILSGEIDHLHSSRIGNLTVQLKGSPAEISTALSFIRSKNVEVDVVWNG